MAHTLGPWRISEFEVRSGGENRMVMGADNFSVAYISGRTLAEHDADAHLIAAAPEMLAALKVARMWSDKDWVGYEIVEAAIAKASGTSAGTAETAQQAQGEARRPDPKGDAHTQSHNQSQ